MEDNQVPQNDYKPILIRRKMFVAPNGLVIDLTDYSKEDEEQVRESAKEMIKEFADMHR